MFYNAHLYHVRMACMVLSMCAVHLGMGLVGIERSAWAPLCKKSAPSNHPNPIIRGPQVHPIGVASLLMFLNSLRTRLCREGAAATRWKRCQKIWYLLDPVWCRDEICWIVLFWLKFLCAERISEFQLIGRGNAPTHVHKHTLSVTKKTVNISLGMSIAATPN